jgi:hypothetical protein
MKFARSWILYPRLIMNFSDVLRQPLLSHPSSTFLHSLREKLRCDWNFPQRLHIFRQSLFWCNKLYFDFTDSLSQNTKTDLGSPSFPFKTNRGERVGTWSLTSHLYHVSSIMTRGAIPSLPYASHRGTQTIMLQALLIQIYILQSDSMCKINFKL